jgi:hypothetical protein
MVDKNRLAHNPLNRKAFNRNCTFGTGTLNRKGGKGGASLISASEKSHLGKNNGCNSRIVKQQLSSLAG